MAARPSTAEGEEATPMLPIHLLLLLNAPPPPAEDKKKEKGVDKAARAAAERAAANAAAAGPLIEKILAVHPYCAQVYATCNTPLGS